MKTDTRTRIINSAIELFSQKGYTETSVKEIATASGIQVGSIYNYFRSKAGILDQVLQMYNEISQANTLTREMIEEMVKTVEPKQLLQGMFYRYPVADADQYTKILKIILHEQYRSETVGNFVKAHLIREKEADVEFILQKLVENKRIGPVNCRYYARILNDLCLAATMHFGHRSARNDVLQEGQLRMDDVIGFVIEMILSGNGEPNDWAEGEGQRWMRNSQRGD